MFELSLSVLPVFGGGEGFEPPKLALQRFSRPPHSTTLPPLRYGVKNQLAGREGFEPQQTVLETVALPIELPSYSGINPPAGRLLSPTPRAKGLLDDFGHLTGADRAATLADGEGQARLHGNRLAQLNRDGHVVTRHHHLGAFRQGQRTGHVSRTEVN